MAVNQESLGVVLIRLKEQTDVGLSQKPVNMLSILKNILFQITEVFKVSMPAWMLWMRQILFFGVEMEIPVLSIILCPMPRCLHKVFGLIFKK